MAGVSGNRRTLYTKKVIKESLIELLKTREIHQVTVTDICKKADINRGTFYTHYGRRVIPSNFKIYKRNSHRRI